MKCPPKILVIALAVALVGSSIVVIVQQSRQPPKAAPPDAVPAAISNYSKTFKLNTNPPIWTTPANGRNATN